MRHIKLTILLLWMFFFCACSSYDEPENTGNDIFMTLWRIIDERYCFFDEKEVDWAEVGAKYARKLKPRMTQQEFFDICADMLAELRDGHVNLISPFDTAYYRRWWTDYSQDFDLRTLQQYYLEFDYHTVNGIIYKVLPGGVGYMYYPSFSYDVGEGNLDYILSAFRDCKGLIIDVRDNGGGDLTNIRPFVGRLIERKITGGYIRHKTGPGHSDFSEPYPIEYEPAQAGRVKWNKPVAVLTNRSCFSAANDFVSVMKQLPSVTVIGARTGGGGGIPFTSELPNGWRVRFSASPVTDAMGRSIEQGIEPAEGCRLHSPADELAQGRDAILDFALARMRALPAE